MPFKIVKRMEVAGSHRLHLPYESKCSNTHGHNWIIEITVETPELTSYGMVIDFTALKKLIHDKLDHKNLNDEFGFNPTAENICGWIANTVNSYLSETPDYSDLTVCSKVSVQESEGNIAVWGV